MLNGNTEKTHLLRQTASHTSGSRLVRRSVGKCPVLMRKKSCWDIVHLKLQGSVETIQNTYSDLVQSKRA